MKMLESARLSGSKVQVLAIALPLAALFLSGCPIYSDNGRPIACSGATACPMNYMCVSGPCQPTTPPCTSNTQCASNQVCIAGMCVMGQPTCETHGDCVAGLRCDSTVSPGRCATSTTCMHDSDCTTSGYWCDFRNTCVPHTTGQCRTRTDCTGGDLCIEGTCTHLPATCQFQYDCPAGTACVNAQCSGLCSTDHDCVAGDSCNTTTHFCEPTVDCSTTATCASGEHCVGGRCLNDCHMSGATCAGGAHQTAYCGGDMFCHPSWQPAAFCPMTPCASGHVCLSGVCRTPCTMPTAGNPDGGCGAIDSTLPYCLRDMTSSMYLCNASMSTTAGCRTTADCTGAQQCVNAHCL